MPSDAERVLNIQCSPLPTPITRVLVCDSQPITIAGLRALLNSQAEEEFAEAGSLERALDFIQNHEFDLLIVDKAFGLTEITEFLATIQEDGKKIPGVVLWGSLISEAETLHLLRLGVRGILSKTVQIPTLISCLRAVAHGMFWIEEDLFCFSKVAESRNTLTAREAQVLELVVEGRTNKEVGQVLGIKAGTVKIHMRHIFDKTGATGRRSLAFAGFFEDRSTIAPKVHFAAT